MLSTSGSEVAIVCGLPTVIASAAAFLHQQGFEVDPTAPLCIMLDIPRGFALYSLESSQRVEHQIIVVTWSFCPEYNEDLWDMGVGGLIIGDGMTLEIAAAIARVRHGARYRMTPGMTTRLTQLERRVLRLLARGYPNQQIAHEINMQVQTVKNTLAAVYRKLGLKNRSEALLYYWGVWHTLAQETSSKTEYPFGR